MHINELASRLHELEQKILLALKNKKTQTIIDLSKNSGLNKDSVQRAIMWLESKKLIEIKINSKQELNLTIKGRQYLKKDLPEIKFLKLIKNKELTIKELSKQFTKDELNASLGLLRRLGAISFINGKAKITSIGKEYINKERPESKLIKALNKPKDMSLLSEKLKSVVDELINRGLIESIIRKDKTIILTKQGQEVIKHVKLEKTIGQLTSEIIIKGTWKNKKFRQYDVTAPVPRTFPGKKHFLYQVMSMIKRFFIEMGFQEMRSNYVESTFWNYDVMFFPQDHPDRGTMDTFYLSNKIEPKIPIDYASIIKKVQENGWITGSKGRRQKWKLSEAKKVILRCHTTQTSFRYLSKKLKPPYKFFSVDRVFRNEASDATHLSGFHQVEGFVVDENLNFRNLLGNLREFYYKMGIKKIKFKPTYNPYTEPSMEIHGYFPGIKKWKALGNSGIFRPEVLEPLGIKSPVIAWGLGLERIAMFIYDIKDVRQCTGHTVDFNTIRTKELLTKIKK